MAPDKQGPADDGKRSPGAGRCIQQVKPNGEGVRGRGGLEVFPDGRLADDGKRSQSAGRCIMRSGRHYPLKMFTFTGKGGVRGGENHAG